MLILIVKFMYFQIVSNFRYKFLLLGLFLSIPSLAFAEPPAAEPIIDGQRAAVGDFPPVARIVESGSTLCSGTLITPQYVLTAAHCFFDERNRQVVEAEGITVELGGVEHTAESVTIHPAYVARSSACIEDETDAALIELSESAGISPIDLVRSSLPTGTRLLLAGFGLEGSGSEGQGESGPPRGKVNIGTTTLDGYGSSEAEDANSTYFYWRFRRGAGGSNTASGDSGGPAFSSVNGVLSLAGITCGGTGNAQRGTESYDTRVDLMRGWIDSVTGGGSVKIPNILGKRDLAGRAGVAFSHELYLAGGGSTSVTASGLPEGLSLSNGFISGLPTKAGTTTFTLFANNSAGSSGAVFTFKASGFTPRLDLRSSKIKVRANTSSSVVSTGRIKVSNHLRLRMKRVKITIGSFSRAFVLDSNGRSVNRSASSFALVGKISSGVLQTRNPRFELRLESSSLTTALLGLGFKDSSVAVNTEAQALPLRIVIDGVQSDGSYTTHFNSSAGEYR